MVITKSNSRPLQALALQILEINRANGWYDAGRAFGEEIALIHSEVSEAFEAFRDGAHPSDAMYVTDKKGNKKPVGIPSEMADIIIRVLDCCSRYGIDIDIAVTEKLIYNRMRGYRHGGKRV